MTTTESSTSTYSTMKDPLLSTWAGRSGRSASRLKGGGRRRSVPYLLFGVLLVLVCAAGGVLAGMRLGDRQSVLALARPVAVGQVLTAEDLKQVTMAADSDAGAVPATAASSVLGQPVAFSLPAGSLVTRSVLGAPQVPAQGMAIAAVGLKSGQFPPDLSPGSAVAVLITPAQGGGTADALTSSWNGVVIGVNARETEQVTVVSLQLSEADARALASAPAGQLSLVVIPGGGR